MTELPDSWTSGLLNFWTPPILILPLLVFGGAQPSPYLARQCTLTAILYAASGQWLLHLKCYTKPLAMCIFGTYLIKKRK